MSTEEESMPMLALKNSRTGRIAATALEKKGLTEFGARFFAMFIQSSGLPRYMNWSDGENAMKALKEAAAKACPAQESVPREVPQGDHQANGEIESAARELKRPMRAVRMQLERNLGFKLEETDPILSWMPTFAGDVISGHCRGQDGKTPYERECGRKWAKLPLTFGERVFLKEAKERK